MKRILSGLLAFVLVLSLVPATPPVAKAAATDSGTCGQNLSWSLDSLGTLTISGTGVMDDFNYSPEPWYSVRASIKHIIILQGVTTIGDRAFEECNNVLSISIPASVTSIGFSAFSYYSASFWVDKNNRYYCSDEYGVLFNKAKTTLIRAPRKLDFYTIPDTVTDIESMAFSFCWAEAIVIPNSVKNIGYSAFAFSNIRSIMIPNSVTKIESEVFYECKSLQSVALSVGTASIHTWAFDGCSALTDIYYTGDNSQQMAIEGNSIIRSTATWHYNCCEVHTYGDNGCLACDYICPHYYKNDCDNVCHLCNRVRQVSDHVYDNSCDSTCSVCSYERTVPDHTYNNACDSDCNECGVSRTVSDHVYDHACDSNCNECGMSRTVPDHVYDDICDANCNICGAVRTNDHVYDNACDKQCNLCGFVREVGDHAYTLNGGFTCSNCKYSKTPAAPELISYQGGIALKAYEGFEYSQDGINWQDSNVFPNSQSKTFYQRVKASAEAQESAISPVMELCTIYFDGNGGSGVPDNICFVVGTEVQLPAEIPTKSGSKFVGWNTMEYTAIFDPGETVAISSDIRFYAMWDDACGTCNQTGQLVHDCQKCRGYGYYTQISYLWCYTSGCPGDREGRTAYIYGDGTKSGFACSTCHNNRGYAAENARKVYCSGDYYGCYDGKYYTTCTTCNGSGRLLQAAPTVISYNHSSVMLLEKAGYEYSYDGITWQTSPIFTGLEPNHRYTFYQRQATTETKPFGTTSSGITVTTDRRSESAIPEPPTLNSRTATSITLNSVEGCEYSNDGINWQWSNTFSDLNCGTEYTFYQRYAKTDTAYAGKSSVGATFKTDKGTQSKPSAPTLSSKTYNSVTLNDSGYQYSRDGINWQTSSTFAGLLPETNYMFYQRKAETDTYYASEASECLIVKTAEPPACVADPTLHSYTNACDTSCDTCGAVRKITHDYTAATCIKAKTCKVCSVTSGKALGHTYSNSCDTSCNVCKAKRTAPHTYSNSCDTSCNGCKAKRSIKHTYSNSCDTKCNVCKKTRKITHTYKTVTTKATLTKNGKTVKQCSVCGKVSSTKTIKYAKTFKLSTTSYSYDGKVKTPSVTVKDSAGMSLKKNTDYTVTYASGRKNVGTYTVTIKLKGNYSGTKVLTFKIDPAKTSVSKLTAGKGSITVAWKKASQVTGYQIQYATSKSFSGAKTVTIAGGSTTKYTLKSLKSKKKYYVRVRAYKTVGSTKFYSAWSASKNIKTK